MARSPPRRRKPAPVPLRVSGRCWGAGQERAAGGRWEGSGPRRPLCHHLGLTLLPGERRRFSEIKCRVLALIQTQPLGREPWALPRGFPAVAWPASAPGPRAPAVPRGHGRPVPHEGAFSERVPGSVLPRGAAVETPTLVALGGTAVASCGGRVHGDGLTAPADTPRTARAQSPPPCSQNRTGWWAGGQGPARSHAVQGGSHSSAWEERTRGPRGHVRSTPASFMSGGARPRPRAAVGVRRPLPRPTRPPSAPAAEEGGGFSVPPCALWPGLLLVACFVLEEAGAAPASQACAGLKADVPRTGTH